MSIFSQPFDPNKHRSEHTPGEHAPDPILPKGYYPCILIDTMEADDGRWFLYKWQVTAGPAKDTKVSVFENTTHPAGGEKATQADRIFRARLSNYCDAVGLGLVNDASELLGKPVKAFFKPWVRKDGTSVNQVSHFRPINDPKAELSAKKPIMPSGSAPAGNEWEQAMAEPSRAVVEQAPISPQGGAVQTPPMAVPPPEDHPSVGQEDYDDDLPF